MINGVGLVPVTCLGLCHVHLEQIKQAERGGENENARSFLKGSTLCRWRSSSKPS